LDAAAPRLVETRTATLDRCFRLLESYSYRNVLARGFALVRDARGEPVTTAAQVRPAQALTVEFQDGPVTVVSTGERKTKRPPNGRQGSLL
ncbi:MAG: exodeoxyribonuclease VII large subunit, partial [Alphaproteobacteria bacterium]|nr:exodeoxyribonuclease VII large subunit [Alphaproteobacteria bacterium]